MLISLFYDVYRLSTYFDITVRSKWLRIARSRKCDDCRVVPIVGPNYKQDLSRQVKTASSFFRLLYNRSE